VRKLCSLAALALALPCVAADWQRIHTPQIEVLTDAGEKAGRATLSRLEQIRGVFATPDPRPLPLRIFLFNSDNEFRLYIDNSTTGGFYQSGVERDFIVLHSGMGLTRAVAHEYVHLILDRGVGQLPIWFEEGTAELYSNFDPQRSRMLVGDPIQEHVAVLGKERWLTGDQLEGANRMSPLYNERTLTGVFYSESWALVHMLNLAPGWRDRMPRFAELLASGRDGDDAFREAFGKTLDQALAELRGYVSRLRGVVLDSPEKSREESVTVESLSQLAATLARADLALQIRHLELAHRLFETAKKAAPDSPDAEAGLGALALAEDRREEAHPHFERAIAMGSRDATTYFQLAMLDRDTRAKAGELLKRAIDLNPDFGEPRFLLGVQASDDGDYESAVNQLGAAAAALPRRSYVWHALAYAQSRLGQTGEARVSASRALRTAGTVAEEQMAEALLNSLK
jgi:tetratricopeptide (TPR) repeat protein